VKATKDHLLAPRVSEVGTLTIDDLDFDIRPLSRKQAMQVYALQEREGPAVSEALLISLGLVDPAMTQDEVEQWGAQPGSAGVLQALSVGIGKISGMDAASGKAAYKSAGGQPGS
jgi:hypothetical protein